MLHSSMQYTQVYVLAQVQGSPSCHQPRSVALVAPARMEPVVEVQFPHVLAVVPAAVGVVLPVQTARSSR